MYVILLNKQYVRINNSDVLKYICLILVIFYDDDFKLYKNKIIILVL